MSFALHLPPEPDGLAAAQDRIEAWLVAAGASFRLRYKLRLVLDELAANLAMHGRFAGPPPPARVALRLDAEGLALRFEDAATPFDPRMAAPPPLPSLEGEAVGGLGLALVRRMAEIVDYQSLPDGWNRTELRIRPG